MDVRLHNIKTLRDAYKAAILTSPTLSPKFPTSSHLLDRVSLFQGDITELEVDAIVNAAKRSLLGGSGVDGAIHAAAGRQLLAECRTLNGCETGESKITKGYNLPSMHVIHTVGPVYSDSAVDKKAKQLASCYKTSLQLAVENKLKHIAFPSISTGVYGYPIDDATHIALNVTRSFLDSDASKGIDRVIFVVWSDEDRDVYRRLIPLYFPPEAYAEESANEQSSSKM